MENDLKRLTGEVVDFAYREVRDTGRMRRACERWPLLAALRAAFGDERTSTASIGSIQPAAGAAALWKE